MNTHEHAQDSASRPQSEIREASPLLGRPVQTALLMVVLVGGFYLLREHWNHVAGNWIYLLLLACPLMHLFHGHGRHGGNADQGFRLRNDNDKA